LRGLVGVPVVGVSVVGVTLLALTVVGCDGGGDDGPADPDSDATLSAPETLPPVPVERTIPALTLAAEDTAFVGGLRADGTVTADELASAYDGYIACLAAGGAAGRYAYDVELRTGLAVDWSLDVDPAVDRDVLGAACSRRYLGDLTRRFRAANPAPDDLAARQRQSIAACVGAVSPEAAANLPEAISIGTAGEAPSVGELQLAPGALDPEALGADPADIDAVSECIASVGVEWRPFG
jgi:hypothetical protein